MSASLVGSEMCIRDSRSGRLRRSRPPATPAMGKPRCLDFGHGAQQVPVSYTHLTLPTIGSV
eukprot:4459218-Alexandrium_andersonii.AAC.1